MNRALLFKELHQHWLAWVFVLVFTFLGFGLFALSMVGGAGTGGVFEVLSEFLKLWLPVLCMLVCSRLVVSEYKAKTQLFLEGLPLSRIRMLTVKYLLGLISIEMLTLLFLTIGILYGFRSEALTLRFVAIMFTRLIVATWCSFSFFFMMGLLGRYRLIFYILLFFGIITLNAFGSVEVLSFGPIALLTENFGLERSEFPMKALGEAAALGGLLMACTVLLGIMREGSVSALLAEKMSHREKVFMGALVIAVMVSFTLVDKKIQKDPFQLEDSVTKSEAGVSVSVSRGGTVASDALSLLLVEFIHRELSALRLYLDLPKLPGVFIARRSDLDGDRYERAELTGSEGLLVRVNPGDARWDQEDFLSWLVVELLVEATEGRAKLESKRWVLDGFGEFWRTRNRESQPLSADVPLALRACYGTPASGLTEVDLDQWLSFREQVGDEVARGVAWSGLRTISSTHGLEACRDFIRSILGVHLSKNITAVFFERANPITKLIHEKAGTDYATLVQKWNENLAASRAAFSMELASVPRLAGWFSFEPVTNSNCQLNYALLLGQQQTSSAVEYRLQYLTIREFNEEVDEADLKEQSHYKVTGATDALNDRFDRGARMLLRFAVWSELMGCDVVSPLQRMEVEP